MLVLTECGGLSKVDVDNRYVPLQGRVRKLVVIALSQVERTSGSLQGGERIGQGGVGRASLERG